MSQSDALVSETAITLTGSEPGETVTVIGGVHGDEVCGVEALKSLISDLEIARGKVHFIFGNPRAIEQCVRLMEMNLNRAFKPVENFTADELSSYERERALYIMPFLQESEALLDIHSSSSKITQPFVICESNSFGIVSHLPVVLKARGFDELHPLGTDGYMNSIGKYGICIECGYHTDPAAVDVAKEAVLAFLSYFDIIDVALPPAKEQTSVHAYGIYKTQTDFVRVREFGDFEKVSKGDVIGTDGGIPLEIEDDNSYVMFVNDCDGPNEEAFVCARYDLV